MKMSIQKEKILYWIKEQVNLPIRRTINITK